MTINEHAQYKLFKNILNGVQTKDKGELDGAYHKDRIVGRLNGKFYLLFPQLCSTVKAFNVK